MVGATANGPPGLSGPSPESPLPASLCDLKPYTCSILQSVLWAERRPCLGRLRKLLHGHRPFCDSLPCAPSSDQCLMDTFPQGETLQQN